MQTNQINSALFVDFDNIYLSLAARDKLAAEEFAENPAQWLEWLSKSLPSLESGVESASRRILIRRCYLNPDSFAKYRPYFIRSAFEVIDCPPLTSRGKTSTDIHLVMDVLDTLRNKHISEFILLSGDADFTPLLLRLRQNNRFSAVVAIGYVSPAYKAASDYVISEETFVDEALGLAEHEEPEAPARPGEPHALAASTPASRVPSGNPLDTRKKELVAWVVAYVKKQSQPVSLASLASVVKQQFGQDVNGGDWLGAGSFKKLLTDIGLGDLQLSTVSPGYVYDPARHIKPATTTPEKGESAPNSPLSGPFFQQYPQIAPLARKISTLTDMPFLSPDQYALLLEELANEVDKNGYSRSSTSKALRDICNDKGAAISRSAVNFILTGIQFSGYDLGARDKESAQALGASLVDNTVNLCKRAQLALSEEDLSIVRAWITGKLQSKRSDRQ